MPNDRYEETQTCRIVLLRGKAPEFLLGLGRIDRTLPEVRIPRRQRAAENLTAALKHSYGIDAVSLSSLESLAEQGATDGIRYEIMEATVPSGDSPHETFWLSVDSLNEDEFRDRDDFLAVRRAITQTMTQTDGSSRGPFATLGWFSDFKNWVQNEIERHGLRLTGRFSQLNASATFCLIRFETDGPAVWFKAVGSPNQREYSLTLALSHSFARFLPHIIATRPDWNGWLMAEVVGPLLNECSSVPTWQTVVRDLAELQIRSLGKSLHLLGLGARDLRIPTLRDLVAPFFRTMGELMKRQTKASPAALSGEQLRRLSSRVLDALTVVEETGIPNALGHLDLNPDNIVCSPAGSVFLDWAEAFVGHPFFTFEYLREHFQRTLGRGHFGQTDLVARYSAPWREFASETDIHRALDVAPLAAVFVCAAGSVPWTDKSRIEEARCAAYLRSLTRRIEREASALAERSVPCPG